MSEVDILREELRELNAARELDRTRIKGLVAALVNASQVVAVADQDTKLKLFRERIIGEAFASAVETLFVERDVFRKIVNDKTYRDFAEMMMFSILERELEHKEPKTYYANRTFEVRQKPISEGRRGY